MNSRDLVLVLGYARSGTSALTRVMSLCGCSLPSEVFGATQLNPSGHWEPVESASLNISFASRLGILGDPSMRLQDSHINDHDKEEFIQKIQDFLARFPRTPIVIKDFQVNELFEFWLEAARRHELNVKTLIALRHPGQVFASEVTGPWSLGEGAKPSGKQQLNIERFNTFWLKTNLLAERYSRGFPRAIVEYPNLMENWRTEVSRISKQLVIDFDVDEQSIDSFISPALYHHTHSGPVVETFPYNWTGRVYSSLSAAAQDKAMDIATLDEIYHAYRTTARSFGLSKTDSSATGQALHRFIGGMPVWQSGVDF